MKIAISGAQGSGKSTLLQLIKKEKCCNGFIFIEEIVRDLKRKENISINQKGDFSSQLRIFQTHVENLSKKNFITDRCLLDAFVYSKWSFENNIFNLKEFLTFEKLFEKFIKKYDIIFYLPVEFALKNDGFRDMDLSFQKEIDNLFIKILINYHLEYKEIKGTKKERVNQIINYLK